MTLYRSIVILGISTSKKFPAGLVRSAGTCMETCTGAEMSDFFTLSPRVDRVDVILLSNVGGFGSFGLGGAGGGAGGIAIGPAVCERTMAGLFSPGFRSVFRLPSSVAWLLGGPVSESVLLAMVC